MTTHDPIPSRGVPRPARAALGLAASLLLGPGPSTVAASPPAEFRVMTFNIRYGTADDGPDRWEHRADLVADVIRDEAPDVVGLQEALKSQLDFLDAELPEYRPVGVGRDDGREAGEFSAILYKADRFELLDSGTFWLSDTPAEPGSATWGNTIPRICTHARLRDRDGKGVIDFYNTHLDHRSAPSRLRSAELIWRRLHERGEPLPFVLTGDFNAGEGSAPLRFLKEQGDGSTDIAPPDPGLVDTFRAVHPEDKDVGTFHGFRGEAGAEKIDYVLVPSGAFEMIEAAIVRTSRDGRYPSDHFPVTARLRVHRQGPSASAP